MAVMVTGASGPVGHALVPLLAQKDEVRAAVRDPEEAEPLRALGAKVTLERLDDADALAEVLAGVFTLVHLVGGPDQPHDHALLDANHGSTVRALAAAREAGVHRFVFVSVPGASAESPVPFLRAKGLAEEAVTTSGLQHAVIRSAPVVGTGSLWFVATVAGALQDPPVVWGSGDRSLAPVAVGDLAAVLAVADDLDVALAGTWALEGPDPVTSDELVAMLAGQAAVPEHLDGGTARIRLSRLLGREVSAHVVDAVTGPARADAAPAAGAFGVSLTPLERTVRETLMTAASGAPGPG
ncbi:MAG TPA: NAD(P)H-binding protein [Actinomycetota bacterium]|nr:NAD(P)H-binding protein [Actinomycetota bacterium]